MSDSSVTAEKPLSNPGLAAASRARSVVARTFETMNESVPTLGGEALLYMPKGELPSRFVVACIAVNVFFAVWIAKLSNPTVGPVLSPASFVGEPRTSWLWRVGDVDERDLDISCIKNEGL